MLNPTSKKSQVLYDNKLFKGFQGFKTIKYLKDNLDEIPNTKGVYIVISNNKPTFLEKNKGGHFKNLDPTVSMDSLKEKWVEEEQIIYIGQAGGNYSRSSLSHGITQFLDFGSGKPVTNWGGRYIWQLKETDDLVIAWKETFEDPRVVESMMLERFEAIHGKLPFANISR